MFELNFSKPSRIQDRGLASHTHIVFLGVFNAIPFREEIENWLRNLDMTGAHLVIADNFSEDSTYEWISSLGAMLPYPVSIIQNGQNFGGYGNLAVNLSKFKNADWITTLHQDDRYSENHIQSHRKLINRNEDGLGLICSESISITPEGKVISYPRGAWLLEGSSDPVKIFLAHLRNHVFPFSGATFAKAALEEFPIPWFSTAFPDTELVMKMCPSYKTVFAPDPTVRYMENPSSESHHLDMNIREQGAFQALLRVFFSTSYERICVLVPEVDRENFLAHLIGGISVRIKGTELRRSLVQAALEITSRHFGMISPIAMALSREYAAGGDYRAAKLLAELGGENPADVRFGAVPIRRAVRIKIPNLARNLALMFFGCLPSGVRKFVFRWGVRTRIGKKLLPAWDFDWN